MLWKLLFSSFFFPAKTLSTDSQFAISNLKQLMTKLDSSRYASKNQIEIRPSPNIIQTYLQHGEADPNALGNSILGNGNTKARKTKNTTPLIIQKMIQEEVERRRKAETEEKKMRQKDANNKKTQPKKTPSVSRKDHVPSPNEILRKIAGPGNKPERKEKKAPALEPPENNFSSTLNFSRDKITADTQPTQTTILSPTTKIVLPHTVQKIVPNEILDEIKALKNELSELIKKKTKTKKNKENVKSPETEEESPKKPKKKKRNKNRRFRRRERERTPVTPEDTPEIPSKKKRHRSKRRPINTYWGYGDSYHNPYLRGPMHQNHQFLDPFYR
eukprot:GHVN01011524.1.p1 GENE.GHVN01011524.1~~GHVN01011524.1.p1  ORF type:complete len:330 (+),score=46.45 GHVN01011524.1:1228-2217(+)